MDVMDVIMNVIVDPFRVILQVVGQRGDFRGNELRNRLLPRNRRDGNRPGIVRGGHAGLGRIDLDLARWWRRRSHGRVESKPPGSVLRESGTGRQRQQNQVVKKAFHSLINYEL